LIDVKE